MATRKIEVVTITLGSTGLGGFAAMDANNETISNLIDPVLPQQPATKNYVDNAIGLSFFFSDLDDPATSVVITDSTEAGNEYSLQYIVAFEQFLLLNNNPPLGGNEYDMSLNNRVAYGISEIEAVPNTPAITLAAATAFFFSEPGTLDTKLNNSNNNSLASLSFVAINTTTNQRLHADLKALKTSTGRVITGWTKKT